MGSPAQQFDPSKPFTTFDPSQSFTVVDQPKDTAAKPSTSSGLGGSFKDFLGGIWDSVNPSGVLHPIDAIHGMLNAQGAEYQKAKDAYDKGDPTTAALHGLAWLVPVLGPKADQLISDVKSGKMSLSSALGQTTGMVAPFVAGDVTIPGSPKIAAMAEAKGASTMADVISPVKGANKTRFANMAQDVAPRLTTEPGLGAGSVEGLAAKVSDRLSQAEDGLDAAAATRLKGRPIPTAPIIAKLQSQIDNLSAQPPNAMAVKVQAQPLNQPIGSSVIPGPNAARVAPLQEAIDSLKKLGPVVDYDAIRTIRQAYDGPAKAIYSPAMTADFLKAQGGKLGAADVTGTLRDTLATASPETAAANAEYSFWRKANDVLEAKQETELANPKVGRRIMGSAAGAITGEALGGPLGAAVGLLSGRMLDAVASNASTAVKINASRWLAQAADAIRTGNAPRLQSAMVNYAKTAGVLDQFQGPISQAFAMPATASDQSSKPIR